MTEGGSLLASDLLLRVSSLTLHSPVSELFFFFLLTFLILTFTLDFHNSSELTIRNRNTEIFWVGGDDLGNREERLRWKHAHPAVFCYRNGNPKILKMAIEKKVAVGGERAGVLFQNTSFGNVYFC